MPFSDWLLTKGHHKSWYKEKFTWVLMTNHACSETFSRHTLVLTPTKVKVSFSLLLSKRLQGCTYFRDRNTTIYICVYLRIEQERDIRGFLLGKGNFETLCNAATKVLKDCKRKNCEWVGRLHVASIQNGELPHPPCEYQLFKFKWILTLLFLSCYISTFLEVSKSIWSRPE